ncbi:MAG: hypothetical protein FJ098_14615, partial [Deltaproteobacteria bacterium]|nr:hypothetical protein [Deltaproteobacteria bacterium]
MMRYPVLLVLLAGLAACDGQGPGDPNDTLRAPADSVPADTEGVDTPVAADTPAEVPGEARFPDAQVPACDPGTGCFLDPCEENGDCQAGWCVGHMGEDVCTLQCQTECPPGWSCEQVPGSAPDVVWVCISAHANLCLPCATGADCKGAAGADDVCVDYGAEGSFCGGVCQEDKDCPWGFSCGDVTTVAGVPTRQCVADAGVCPCTKKSVSLGLFTPCVVENAEGACPGKRVCTTEGLTPCDAMEPASEICDGQDNDCDGDTDEPLEIGGNYVNLCDDQNPCTTDSCGGAGGCSHQSLVQGECVDGDACTIGDHCEDGVCTGLPILCDDGDLCTDDSCDGLGGCQIAFNQAACDDGDPCTVGDGCQDGLCAGWPVDCACDDDADCAPLEDGNPCNGSLVCSKDKLPFSCIVDPDTVVLCPPIPGGDLCTEMVCDPGTGDCVADPAHEGYACDDGDSCTLGDLCQEGTCQGGPGLLCADGNPCTTDGCDPEEGCTFTPSSGACNDGNACTKGDFCSGGQCVAGPVPLSCSDQNSCTLDACDPFAGCTHVPAPGSCNDGNACT